MNLHEIIGETVSSATPATEAHAAEVLSAPVGEGRSEHFWLRLEDGTLLLACFPQGDHYFLSDHDGG